jgi:hypothetical protein
MSCRLNAPRLVRASMLLHTVALSIDAHGCCFFSIARLSLQTSEDAAMAVARTGNGRLMALVWAVVLVGPVAWSVSFGLMFWLTKAVCESGDRLPMGTVGVAGAALVTAGLFFAARIVREEAVAEVKSLRFLADLATWGNAFFLLVLVLAAVPILLLSPCGV